MKERLFYKDVILLLVASVFVHLLVAGYVGLTQGFEVLDADEQEYLGLARQLVDGSLNLYPRRVLGHVSLLAAGLLVGGSSLVTLQILVTVFFSLSVPLVYILIMRILNNRCVAVCSSVLILFWPPFLYYGATIYSETTALPCFLMFLICLPKSERFAPITGNYVLGWIFAGVCLGLCMHIRPMYLLFLPFAILIILIEALSLKRFAKNVICFLVGVLIVVGPWSVYLSSQTKHFLILSSNGGETIAGGINSRLIEDGIKTYTTPDGRVSWHGPGKWSYNPEYLSFEEKRLPPVEQNQILFSKVKDWVKQHPKDFIYLESVKLAYMWTGYPFKDSWAIVLFGGLGAFIFFVGWVLSLIYCRTSLCVLSRVWLLPIFASVVALISWGSWRFRQPGMVGAIVMTVILLDQWITRDRYKEKKQFGKRF